MKIIYPELKKSFTASQNSLIFLKHKNIWFFLPWNNNQINSRYWGGFFFDGKEVWKFLDEIRINNEIKEIKIINPWEVMIIFKNNDNGYVKINFPDLKIIFNSFQDIEINFDIKKIFDNNPWPRKINIKQIDNDKFLVDEFYERKNLKILIQGIFKLEKNNLWIEKKMEFDQQRNSPPFQWWVFHGIAGKVKEIEIKIIDQGINFDNNSDIFIKKFSLRKNFLEKFILERISLLKLNNYLPAGFPWFFENWYRDELISLYLLKTSLNKEYLLQRLDFYLNNLEILWSCNKSNCSQKSADTFLFFLINLESFPFYLKKNFDKLITFFGEWEKNFLDNSKEKLNLPPKSTWKDSLALTNSLEIISLYLKSLLILSRVKENFQSQINLWRKIFLHNIESLDIDIVFAYLFLKHLLNKQSWEKIFDQLIEKYFLDWGAFTSHNKNSPDFRKNNDGEIGLSYHRGDSWYFINNLLASFLIELNYSKYKSLVEKIIKNSLEDLLLDGVLGYSSEISDAQERSSKGSLVQLWSMSTLIYLLRFFKNIDIVLKSLSNSHNIITVKS